MTPRRSQSTSARASTADADSDVLPRNLQPMLARLDALPARDEEWAYEVKWDGMRALLYLEDGTLRILTRNQNDVTAQYPELAPLAEQLARHRVILDGEIVVLDRLGRPSFERLQTRFGLTSATTIDARAAATPVCLMAFDVLHLDGRDLTGLPYEQRRLLLRDLLTDTARWRVPAHRIGDGTALLEAVREQGMEGIIAKRLGSTYQPGKRGGDWRKVKVQRRQELVIGGWTLGTGRRAGTLGALLLGWHDEEGRLVYAGSVGTGFSDALLDRISEQLRTLAVDASPFDVGGPDRARQARWVRPELVCEVAYAHVTQAGTLRHPTFLGLRTDKDAREVVREDWSDVT